MGQASMVMRFYIVVDEDNGKTCQDKHALALALTEFQNAAYRHEHGDTVHYTFPIGSRILLDSFRRLWLAREDFREAFELVVLIGAAEWPLSDWANGPILSRIFGDHDETVETILIRQAHLHKRAKEFKQ